MFTPFPPCFSALLESFPCLGGTGGSHPHTLVLGGAGGEKGGAATRGKMLGMKPMGGGGAGARPNEAEWRSKGQPG